MKIDGKQIKDLTITQSKLNLTSPILDNDAATKEYVDGNKSVEKINVSDKGMSVSGNVPNGVNTYVLVNGINPISSDKVKGSYIEVFLNTTKVDLGPNEDFQFQPNGGGSPRSLGEEEKDDQLYVNTLLLGYGLDSTDTIDFNYIISDTSANSSTYSYDLGIEINRATVAEGILSDRLEIIESDRFNKTGSVFIHNDVPIGTGYTNGYDYATYIKQESKDTSPLTNTQRSLLVENIVHTNGSGNQYSLNYANSITSASHYKGSSDDLSLATVGLNGEANVENPLAAIYASGFYGIAISPQLGVNSGGTFVAQNASTSNLGIFSFSDTAGFSQNRAAYFALSTDSIDFDNYRVARVMNPLPVSDAALILDDYTGLNHALYANGKVQIDGEFIINPSVPTNSTSDGIKGSVTYDSDYIYICTGTNNWKRTPLTTW